ncbi:MAG: hypothetical protein HYR63_04435 [Proteobacteria bacterium]|nr:hypothetical protein [Pseudomonadota bacterium]MBI3499642.1 hypothetical protein [Pseudomonadota bacterium]
MSTTPVGSGDITAFGIVALKSAEKSQAALAQLVTSAADNAAQIAATPGPTPPGSGRGQNVNLFA